MAKLGIEVEGRLKGIKTIFVDAPAVLCEGGVEKVRGYAAEHNASHVYISDRSNVLNYQDVGAWFEGLLVTMDVTNVYTPERPANVTVILTLPYEHWASVANLGAQDQVKFHSEDRHVLCAQMNAFVPTHPSEFAGDVEL